MIVIEIRRYVNQSGIDVVGDWLAHLGDLKARARIAARLDRLTLGNFGDCKALREGCPNSESTGDQDIGCTTWSEALPRLWFFAAVTRVRKMKISGMQN